MSENTEIDPNTVRELERARADLKSLREELRTSKAEIAGARAERDEAFKARDGYKGQLAQQKADFEAKIAESAEAAAKAKAEADAALSQARAAADQAVIAAEAKAVATRLGAHNPADVVRLVDLSAVKRGEDGAIEGLEDVLTAAKAERAYLFGEPPKSGVENGTTVVPPAPKAGEPAPFDARKADGAEYEAAKAALLRA